MQDDVLRLPDHQHYEENDEQRMLREEVFGKPPKILARFYIDAEKDFKNSTKECPLYIEQVMVFLQVVGDKDSLTAIATNDHKRLYPREWALFDANKDRHPIPLTSLPQMRPVILKAMNDLGVRSVDDVIEKPLPEYLEKYKKWATWIKSVHDTAEGKPKLRVVV